MRRRKLAIKVVKNMLRPAVFIYWAPGSNGPLVENVDVSHIKCIPEPIVLNDDWIKSLPRG